MPGGGGEPDGGGERLTLRRQAGESRQQRRVDIDQPVGPGFDKAGIEEAHEPGQRDQLDCAVVQHAVRRGGEGGAVGDLNGVMRYSGSGRVRQPRRVAAIADDGGDFGGIGGVRGSVDQRLQV
jgi:hypothetical protein